MSDEFNENENENVDELDEMEDVDTADSVEADDPFLDLSNEESDEKPRTIKLPQGVYQLKSYDNLSPDQEATVTATFARFMRAFEQLGQAKGAKSAKEIALRLQAYRVKLICLMTTIPEAVVKRLGPSGQGKLLSAVQKEISADAVLGDDEDGEDV